MFRGPTVMRGKAIDRALIAQKLFAEDIDARVRKVCATIFNFFSLQLLTMSSF